MSLRLTCNVTPEVKAELKAIGLSIQTKKGGQKKAIQLCLEKAFAAPRAPARDFVGEASVNCSVEATPEEIIALNSYQVLLEIDEQRKGFRNALLRGLSIYLDEKERSGTTKKPAVRSGQGSPKLPL